MRPTVQFLAQERQGDYAVVNASRSNEGGCHWELALQDGTGSPSGVACVDPYDGPRRFSAACRVARQMGRQARALGAGHQTCGWRCGYISLWWSMWLGRRGDIPCG